MEIKHKSSGSKSVRQKLKQKVSDFLTEAGITDGDASTLADLIIEQQIVGNQFDPVGKLRGKHEQLVNEIKRAGNAEVVVDNPSAMLIKGNGRVQRTHDTLQLCRLFLHRASYTNRTI